MADWFVQHGGKQYGPLPAAKLKQLAADGKISPTTSVRLGTDGAWVPASRVKGLFDSMAPASPSRPPATPRANVPPSAPPIAPAPLVATPLVRAQPPKVTPLAKGTPVAGKSVPALVVGGISLVLGILALATCWLPAMGAGAAWVAIGIASTGLIVGIVAFVMAAMHKGSGLALGIAGTSTSLVAGALSIVVWMFFSQLPTPPKVIAVAPPVVQPAPPPVAPTPEAEPEPEPVWTDAHEAIEQGPIRARIAIARIEPVTLESIDLSTLKRQKAKPMLKVRVSLENISTDTIVSAPGWPGGADLVGQGVTELLGGDAGKALKSATASAALADNAGNNYKQVPIVQVFGAKLLASADPSLRPTEKVEHDLVFAEPLPTIEYLRLELTPAGFNGNDSLRFQIGRDLIQGLKAPSD